MAQTAVVALDAFRMPLPQSTKPCWLSCRQRYEIRRFPIWRNVLPGTAFVIASLPCGPVETGNGTDAAYAAATYRHEAGEFVRLGTATLVGKIAVAGKFVVCTVCNVSSVCRSF
ncbi:hypothetical protein C7N83_12960 [Neisseria iguanae]|uniref:Uncharacterized protein n=1 Tax=Neisseria iguanae TaxID=90242 RepID=A0A2P7TX88_9NEIS|nr:hypothetical protein C7N83_12960 [Neisseria iguanae]